ncbi:hypothetical protein RHECNPAF_930052 [Rhizobium etli CNPAF512]|nr:hypothetical protein RHECNPAF_930052 [Rhizobium etli CNPAF512]
MAMRRSAGSTSLTTLPPMRSSPEVISSSPAIILSSVDLPQPDGPTKTTNSPSFTSRLAPWMISKPPKRLTILLSESSAMQPPRLFDCAGRDAGDEMALQHDEHDENRRRQQHRAGHDTAPGDLGEADQCSQCHRRRHHPRSGIDQQRPEVIVPRVQEENDRQCRHRRARQRQGDAQEDLPFLDALDAGRIEKLARHHREGLPHEQDAERIEERRNDQRHPCVRQLEFARHHDELRDDDHRERQRDRAKDDGDDDGAADETVTRQRPAGHRGQQHREDGVDDCDADGDHHRADEIGIGLQVLEICDEVGRRPEHDLRAEDPVIRHGREDEHHPERKQPDQRQRREHGVQRDLADEKGLRLGSHFGSLPSQRLRSEITTARAAIV